jgi:hypothetical protein
VTDCACPLTDASECYRHRHNIDLRELVDGIDLRSEDDDYCRCSCHDGFGRCDACGAEFCECAENGYA